MHGLGSAAYVWFGFLLCEKRSFSLRKLNFLLIFLFCLNSMANEAPFTNDDAYSTDWSTRLMVPAPGVLGNDGDADNDSLQAHLLTGPEQGTLMLFQDGSFGYQPVFGFDGDVTFEYKAWDGITWTAGKVTITVSSGNQAPIANNDVYTLTSTERYYQNVPGVLANDSDPDGDALETHLVNGPSVGTLGFHHDGSFWYEPEPGYQGQVTFDYNLSDGNNKTLATVTLIIEDPSNACATRADRDNYGRFSGGHAFWLPRGLGRDFVFDGDGEFRQNADGTAVLTGTIRRERRPSHAFYVEVHFGGYTERAAGAPKKELVPRAYKRRGGPVDVSTWYYYTSTMGTLTGIDAFEGALVDISRRGPAMQVGYGANGKNVGYGASTWLNWRVIRQGDTHNFRRTRGTGDINIDLCD